MPFFSVIIPLYNKENYIESTLQSVLNQSFEDFEVILVDDGSTDESIKVVSTFKDKRIKSFSQRNSGPSAARNFGVSKASGEWVALLDADDLWSSHHLSELLKTIKTVKAAQVVSNAYQVRLSDSFIKIPKYSKPIPSHIKSIDNYFIYSYIDPLFWTSSIAFKKNCFDSIHGFDEDIYNGEDMDFIIRLALNFKLAYNPKITLTYHRNTENNQTDGTGLVEKLKYIHKHKNTEKDHPSLKKYLDINRFSYIIQAKQLGQDNLEDLMQDISKNNLNFKQQILLLLPGVVLRVLKKIQSYLIRKGYYKSAFS